MFRARVLIIRRSKLLYTASGIITHIGGRLVHRLREKLWPPDDEHMCSKHVEAWNKLTVKRNFCVPSWLITEINVLWSVIQMLRQIQTSDESTDLLAIKYHKLVISTYLSHKDITFFWNLNSSVKQWRCLQVKLLLIIHL